MCSFPPRPPPTDLPPPSPLTSTRASALSSPISLCPVVRDYYRSCQSPPLPGTFFFTPPSAQNHLKSPFFPVSHFSPVSSNLPSIFSLPHLAHWVLFPPPPLSFSCLTQSGLPGVCSGWGDCVLYRVTGPSLCLYSDLGGHKEGSPYQSVRSNLYHRFLLDIMFLTDIQFQLLSVTSAQGVELECER